MKNEDETYFSYEAVKRIPSSILKNIDELIEYQMEHIEKWIEKQNFDICENSVYSYDNTNIGKGLFLRIIQSDNKIINRAFLILLDYKSKERKYEVSLEIDAEYGKMWGGGDGYIYIFEYIYRNNFQLYEKIKDLLFTTSLDDNSDSYYNYLKFNLKKDKKRVYTFLKEAIEWVFTQEEIIEVLKGNKWLEGYCPPSPF